MTIEKDIRNFALLNASTHGGKANLGSIIGQLFQKYPEIKKDMKDDHIFHVDYSTEGEFILHIGMVSQGGDLNVFLDGKKIGEQKVAVGFMCDKAFTIKLPRDFDPGASHRLVVRVKKDLYAAGIWKPASIVTEK